MDEESTKLKQLMADLSSHKKMLEDVLSQKLSGPLAVKCVLVREEQVAYQVAERRACRVLGFFPTTEAEPDVWAVGALFKV